MISIDRNNSTLRRWVVFSQGKRPTLVRYLFGKWLWDELNSVEMNVFWHMREITDDITIFLSLKAKNLGTSKREIRQRLEHSPFPELQFISRQSYLTLKGRVTYFLYEEVISLRKVEKYSGYTKHYKDKGSLGIEREFYLSEIFDPYENVSEEILLRYLTVGDFALFQESVQRPDDWFQGEPKRSNPEL